MFLYGNIWNKCNANLFWFQSSLKIIEISLSIPLEACLSVWSVGRQQRQNSTSEAMLRPTWDSAITVIFVGNISRPQILFKCIFLSPIEQNLRLYKHKILNKLALVWNNVSFVFSGLWESDFKSIRSDRWGLFPMPEVWKDCHKKTGHHESCWDPSWFHPRVFTLWQTFQDKELIKSSHLKHS